ncbi:MAG: regulatory protein LuxR [Ilumatobacteraceae bacterium]|nr:regulatory protein LuxR [Ilumatobacteraceae bacterium]
MVAQWLEQGTHNPWVAGSIPARPTEQLNAGRGQHAPDYRGAVAELLERGVHAPVPQDYAFVFTDIEGSTAVLTELGAGYPAVLHRHRDLLRHAFETHGGSVVDAEGDACFAMFADAGAAISGCIDAQRAIDGAEWPMGSAPRVRMGVHVGQAWLVGGKPYGTGVHEGARVGTTAHGGQIIVSAPAASAAPEVSYVDLGMVRLRDVVEPMQLFQVDAPGLATDFPPPRAERIRQGNLPQFLTSFVGRAEAVGTLAELAVAERLITVVGPGGIGKTRLAVEAASAAAGGFPGGAWFVDLAAISESSSIDATFVASLAIAGGDAERSDLDAVIELVDHAPTLVVIDNCEHVLGQLSSIVAEMLRRTTRLRVIATSREPLGIVGERQIPIDVLDEATAAELFTARARQVDPAFVADRESIGLVCCQLDHLPLAIELAAARVRTFGLTELSARLATSTSLLRGPASAPERQRSLTATIDWSVQLLTPEERTLLAALSVFPASFTLPGVIDVLSGTGADSVDEQLDSLVSKSLVSSAADGAARRFRLLDLVRSYAAQLLTESARGALRDRHADFVMAACRRLRPELEGAEPSPAIARLRSLEPDLRSAFEHLTDLRDDRRLLRLVASSGPMGLRNCGVLTETQDWIDAALATRPDLDPQSRLDVLTMAAILYFVDDDELRRIKAEGVALARALGDEVSEALILSSIWVLDESTNDVSSLMADVEWAHSVVPSSARPGPAGIVAWWYVNLLRRDGQGQRSVEVVEALDRASPEGLGLHDPLVRYQIGKYYLAIDDLDRAQRWFDASTDSARRRSSGPGIGTAEFGQGLLARARRDPVGAAEHFRRAVDRQAIEGGLDRTMTLAMLAEAELRSGNIESAEALLPEVRRRSLEREDEVLPRLFLEAQIHLARGRIDDARTALAETIRVGRIWIWHWGVREALMLLAELAEQDDDVEALADYRGQIDDLFGL